MTRLVDADSHYYEPRDCFTRYLPAALVPRSVRAVCPASGLGLGLGAGPDAGPGAGAGAGAGATGDPGSVAEASGEVVMVGDQPFTFLPWRFDVAPVPGCPGQAWGPMRNAYVERGSRLAAMSEQGVDSAILFPTYANCVEPALAHDLEALCASYTAFNRWVEETWGFDGRIMAAALLSLRDPGWACQEVERLLSRGARVVALSPGPVAGRSVAHPSHDPIWARLAEAGCVVAFHISASPYEWLYGPAWGEPAGISLGERSAFWRFSFFCDRPIMDTLGALVLEGTLDRFPRLRLLSVEHGSAWLPYLLEAVDRAASDLGAEPPSFRLRQQLWISPFPSENLRALIGVAGSSRVVMGSDWPHAEGLVTPYDYVPLTEGLSETERDAVLRSNAAALLDPTREPPDVVLI